MQAVTAYLTSVRRITRLYDDMLKAICERYHLTMIEGTIISFLYNNPDTDTAGDIAELRMLSKGNVSQAVESLIQKKMLKRRQDTADRRKIHLSLLPESEKVTDEIQQMKETFSRELFEGFSDAERERFQEFHNRIIENVKHAVERRERR